MKGGAVGRYSGINASTIIITSRQQIANAINRQIPTNLKSFKLSD